ncbi:hypothetical protein C8R44DRAFT_214720 [Mycena epipterygia]|nr:hypothetical protein C8R44DRAFT_214720 [Mycena epipterygia]
MQQRHSHFLILLSDPLAVGFSCSPARYMAPLRWRNRRCSHFCPYLLSVWCSSPQSTASAQTTLRKRRRCSLHYQTRRPTSIAIFPRSNLSW